MESKNITPELFFNLWNIVCKDKESDLVKRWTGTGKEYSNHILGRDNKESVIYEINKKLEEKEFLYEIHQEYYGCDVVFYNKEDLIQKNPLKCNTMKKTPAGIDGVWLKNIRIHLEHENNIRTSFRFY